MTQVVEIELTEEMEKQIYNSEFTPDKMKEEMEGDMFYEYFTGELKSMNATGELLIDGKTIATEKVEY